MQRNRGRKLMGEINVVPYIDVMLVLLIIFMVTAPMLSQGIKVDLPKAAAEPIEPDKLEPLVLSVDRDGRHVPEHRRSAGGAGPPNACSRWPRAALRREPERPVLVKADRAVAYGRVVEGMVLLQQAGAKKVGFVTEPVAAERAPERGALSDAGLRARAPAAAGRARRRCTCCSWRCWRCAALRWTHAAAAGRSSPSRACVVRLRRTCRLASRGTAAPKPQPRRLYQSPSLQPAARAGAAGAAARAGRSRAPRRQPKRSERAARGGAPRPQARGRGEAGGRGRSSKKQAEAAAQAQAAEAKAAGGRAAQGGGRGREAQAAGARPRPRRTQRLKADARGGAASDALGRGSEEEGAAARALRRRGRVPRAAGRRPSSATGSARRRRGRASSARCT